MEPDLAAKEERWRAGLLQEKCPPQVQYKGIRIHKTVFIVAIFPELAEVPRPASLVCNCAALLAVRCMVYFFYSLW